MQDRWPRVDTFFHRVTCEGIKIPHPRFYRHRGMSRGTFRRPREKRGYGNGARKNNALSGAMLQGPRDSKGTLNSFILSELIFKLCTLLKTRKVNTLILSV